MTRKFPVFLLLLCLVLQAGTGFAGNLPEAPSETAAYILKDSDGLLDTFAPVFVVEHNEVG